MGHGAAGCVQFKQGLIVHKVSHAPLFFIFTLSVYMCERGEKVVKG